MSDNYPVDSSDLRARGTKGVMSVIGGGALLIVNSLLHLPLLGAILSGGLVIVGLGALFGKTKTDKVVGGVALVAGIAGLSVLLKAIPILGAIAGLSSFAIGAGAVALLAFGGWNIFKFIKGLRSRA
jgi:hypothetical protein